MTSTTVPYFLEDDEFVKMGPEGYYVIDSAPDKVKKDFKAWITRIKERNNWDSI